MSEFKPGMVLIKAGSHRAREKMYAALGRKPQEFYSLWESSHLWEVRPSEYEKLKGITGITRARPKMPEKYGRTIPSGVDYKNLGWNTPRFGGKRRKVPLLAWRRPADLNELWEAVGPRGGRYVIRMIGAYRTGATRYEVSLTGASYHSAYLGDFKTADAAKRIAAAHANRAASAAGGKRRHAPSQTGVGKQVAALNALLRK